MGIMCLITDSIKRCQRKIPYFHHTGILDKTTNLFNKIPVHVCHYYRGFAESVLKDNGYP